MAMHLTSAFSKSSVFGRPHYTTKPAFSNFSTLETVFKKLDPFSVAENAVLVLAVGQTGGKKMRF